MKYVFAILFGLAVISCAGFDCQAYGPQANLSCAFFGNSVEAFGGSVGGVNYLFLYEDDLMWHNYVQNGGMGLPISAICSLNDSTLLVTMGMGSYSDGVYNFNLQTHEFQINEWIYMPSDMIHCNTDNCYYICADALYKSENGTDWDSVSGLPHNTCACMAYSGNHYVAQIGNETFYSNDAGVTWQSESTYYFDRFRFASDGTLYAIMNRGTESDGLFRSFDYGATWQIVQYSDRLSAIGPDFDGYIPIGKLDPDGQYQGVALLNPQDEMLPLNHESLNTNIAAIDVFPFIDTPSFYVLTPQGCFYVFGFLPQPASDQTAPTLDSVSLQAYPNPAKTVSTIQINGKTADCSALSIYNSKGQLVKSLTVRQNPALSSHGLRWDLRDNNGKKVPSGIYLLNLKSNGRLLSSGKLIVLP